MSTTPQEKSQDQPAKEQKAASWVWTLMSVAGAVAAVGAWCVMMNSEKISFWCAVAALLLSCPGLKSGGRGWRNLSVTAIIASGVLLLVYGIFWGAIFFTLKSL